MLHKTGIAKDDICEHIDAKVLQKQNADLGQFSIGDECFVRIASSWASVHMVQRPYDHNISI